MLFLQLQRTQQVHQIICHLASKEHHRMLPLMHMNRNRRSLFWCPTNQNKISTLPLHVCKQKECVTRIHQHFYKKGREIHNHALISTFFLFKLSPEGNLFLRSLHKKILTNLGGTLIFHACMKMSSWSQTAP